MLQCILKAHSRCWMVRIAVALALLLCAAPKISAQVTRPYDVRHYDLFIEPDFVQKTIRVVSTLTIDNFGLADTFRFGLNDQYRITSARANGAAASVKRANGEIEVTVKPQKRVTLVIELSAQKPRSDGEDRNVIEDTSLFLLWSDRFYPIRFDDWATVRTTVVLPEGFQAIAPGRLVETRPSGGHTTLVFEAARPAVCLSIFADSRWIRRVKQIRGQRMQTLLHPESQKFSEQVFRTSSDILQFYSELYGPSAYGEFSFVTLTGMGARRAFAGFVGYEPKYLEKEMTTTGYDAHETALLWWGLTTRGTGPGSWQWTEGFGDYAELLYAEARHTPLASIFQYFRDQYLKLPAEQDVPYAELRGRTPQSIVHGKYPWLMHVLRYQVGDAAFRKAMRLLFRRYRLRTFTMDEFVATLEAGTGQSLKQWREQWLERKGVPILALRYSLEPGKKFLIRGTIEQRGELYDLPLEIGIVTPSGTRVEKVTLKDRVQSFTFISAEKPMRIELDPNRWLLIKKIYEDSSSPSPPKM